MYTADAQTGNSIRIVHLYGSAYDMGYAHGQLLHDDIIRFYTEFEAYADQMVAPYVKNLPKVGLAIILLIKRIFNTSLRPLELLLLLSSQLF